MSAMLALVRHHVLEPHPCAKAHVEGVEGVDDERRVGPAGVALYQRRQRTRVIYLVDNMPTSQLTRKCAVCRYRRQRL
eukprot:560224-Pleurochrysis_carterae.AAC.3